MTPTKQDEERWAKEQRAKMMLKRNHQPKDVASKLNLSLEWVEIQARRYGKMPFEVQ